MVKAREIEGLDCDAPAADGARLVLLTRLEETLALRDAALDPEADEGIHDMRVASRRLRSALKDFLPYLRPKRFKQARKTARQLADALGRVRDAEVAIAGIDAQLAECPAELAAALALLADEKNRLREAALSRLREALDRGTLESLREEFENALAPEHDADSDDDKPHDDKRRDDDDDKPHGDGPPDAGDDPHDGDESGDDNAGNGEDDAGNAGKQGEGDDSGGGGNADSRGGKADGSNGKADGGEDGLSFREAGRTVIEKRLAELTELSPCLFDPTASRKLHELRLAAKRLRYALELFSPCYGDSLRRFAKEIAHLQSSLGELHDCDEWIDQLGDRLSARGGVDDDESASVWSNPHARPTVERRAGMWLVRRFARARAEHFDAALARWHAWEAYGLLEHLRRHVARQSETGEGEGEG